MLILSLGFLLNSCDALLQLANSGGPLGKPSESEISTGIKEVLRVGITNAITQSSQRDGFYGNSLIRIPFPPEAEQLQAP